MINFDEFKQLFIKYFDIEKIEYLEKYIDLIKKNLLTPAIKTKTQSHHIIPHHVSNKNIIDWSDYKSFNMHTVVNLLYKDHCLAHYYLNRATKNSDFKIANFLAFKFVLGNKYYRNDLAYTSENIFLKNLEHYQKMYEESMQLLQIKYSGNVWIHKKNIQKHISIEFLDDFLSNGWILGRYDLICIHKNYKNKFINNNLIKNYIDRGWIIGETTNKKPKTDKEIYIRQKNSPEKKPVKILLSAWDEYDKNIWSIVEIVCTEEQKTKISNSVKLLWQEADYKKNQIEKNHFKTCINSIWLNNGVVNKRIFNYTEDMIESLIAEGWLLGKLKQDKIWINLNGKNRCVVKDNIDHFLAQGWEVGKLTDEDILNWKREHPKKPSIPKYIWIEKDDNKIRIEADQLSDYISQGWKRYNASRGSITVHKGTTLKRINKDDLSSYIAEGWVKGEFKKSDEWLRKISEGKKGKTTKLKGSFYINNGLEEKRIHDNLFETYTAQGWKRGRLHN